MTPNLMASEKYQGVSKQSFGYKLLTQQGWTEGRGLGLDGKGISQHVKVKTKNDSKGVGLDRVTEQGQDWGLHMASYDQLLRRLGTSGTPANVKENPSTAVASAPASPQNFGLSVCPGKKPGKLPNLKEEPSVRQVAARDAQPIPRPPNPRGRFKRHEASKMVGAYSTNDLAAILGGLGVKQAGSIQTRPSAAEQEKGKIASCGSGTNGEQKRSAGSQSSTPPPAKRAKKPRTGRGAGDPAVEKVQSSIEPQGEERESGHAELPAAVERDTEGQEWLVEGRGQQGFDNPIDGDPHAWWRSIFVKGTKLRADDKCSKVFYSKRKEGFLEEEQVELYGRAKDAATTGRVGLGRSSMPRKVGGARWQGKKTKLGSDSDSDEEPGSDGEQGERSDRVVVIQAKSRSVPTALDGVGMGENKGIDAAQCTARSSMEGPQTGGTNAQQAMVPGRATERVGKGIRNGRGAAEPTGQAFKGREGTAQGEVVESEPIECTGGPGRKEKIKWKGVLSRVLKTQPATKMKVMRVAKLIAEAAGQQFDKRKHRACLVKAVERLQSVAIEGKHVVRLQGTC